MFLAAASHLMLSNAVQGEIHCSSKGIEGFGMKLIHVFGNVIQGDASYTADCACKIFINDFLGNTDSLKDLCALIGLDGGNTHFGSNFYNAVDHSVIVVIYCRIIIFVQQFFIDQLLDRLQRQIWIDCTGPISKKGCKMMYLSWFSGFQDQRKRSLFLGIYQMLVYRRYRQQRRNGHMVLIHPSVGKDQDVSPVFIGFIHLYKETVNGSFQLCTLVVSNRNHRYLKAFFLHVLDL